MGTSRQKKQRAQDDDRPGVWVAYGKLVKLWRNKSGLTQQELAEAVGYSCDQLASIEQGRRPAKSAFTDAAEVRLKAGGTLAVLQDDVDLAKLPLFFQDFALIETEAVSRFSSDPLLIPGLLQTEDYARALFSEHCPPLSDEMIEQHVEARLSRQKLLTRTPMVETSFIIGEQALTSMAGSVDVVRGQLEHLLKQGAMRNVEIQVMPSDGGFHLGLNGPVVIMETLEHRQVGYIESQGVGLVVTDAAKVSGFALRHGRLRSQALNVEKSTCLIERMAGEA
ncbi:helix-turn-helix transcriptional regulator [Streptomyces scopuliridis]|uniref:Helix-turn-helix transcriptional regulator n=1 Tax=Streptomyces scopuliridis TaxID=452529 RepID=A0ACD4ZHK9_9ACTN|nr:helix-turn-helix transcriptional regulator [Streptomyces scopuliridis]WSB97780.1 helix-turn-helix transcriptional regulator [Streptomyces scopuliridis]WSC08517.1 helix-turn-helix transcriptional regulator [Streptomyces scopuliridis]